MRRGFTLLELSVVVSLIALVTPIGFLFYRNLQADHLHVRSRLDAARETRTLSEALRRDLWAGRLRPGDALVIDHPCGEISYVLDALRVERRAFEACGGTFTVASHVAALERSPGSVTVRFEWPVTPRRTLTAATHIGLGGGTR